MALTEQADETIIAGYSMSGDTKLDLALLVYLHEINEVSTDDFVSGIVEFAKADEEIAGHIVDLQDKN
jgi:hypothetical protein